MDAWLREAWQWVYNGWETGNLWFRNAIRFYVVWFVALTVVGLMGSNGQVLAGWVNLMPLALVPIVLLAYIDPLVVAAVNRNNAGHSVGTKILMVLGGTFAYGIYLQLVPVYNNLNWFPIFLGTVLSMICFLPAPSGNAKKWVMRAGVVIIVILTWSWTYNGGKAPQAITPSTGTSDTTTGTVRNFVLAFTGGYPICGATQGVKEVSLPGLVEVELREDCWSGPISLPDGSDYHVRVRNGAGWLAYQWPNGKWKRYGADDNSSVNFVGIRSFRLMGQGIARVSTRRNSDSQPEMEEK